MTIVIAFHSSGYRTFKDFYKQKVLADWRDAFPNLVSYGRFVELMPWSFMGRVGFLNTRCFGEVTGISLQLGYDARPADETPRYRSVCGSSPRAPRYVAMELWADWALQLIALKLHKQLYFQRGFYALSLMQQAL